MRAKKTVAFLGKLYGGFYIYRLTRLWDVYYLWFSKKAYRDFTGGRDAKIRSAFSLQLMAGGRMTIGDDFQLVSAPPLRCSAERNLLCSPGLPPPGASMLVSTTRPWPPSTAVTKEAIP